MICPFLGLVGTFFKLLLPRMNETALWVVMLVNTNMQWLVKMFCLSHCWMVELCKPTLALLGSFGSDFWQHPQQLACLQLHWKDKEQDKEKEVELEEEDIDQLLQWELFLEQFHLAQCHHFWNCEINMKLGREFRWRHLLQWQQNFRMTEGTFLKICTKFPMQLQRQVHHHERFFCPVQHGHCHLEAHSLCPLYCYTIDLVKADQFVGGRKGAVGKMCDGI